MATNRKSPARARKAQSMSKNSRPAGILLRFRSESAWNEVSRDLLREMARRLNMTETATVHIALADRARALGLIPRREPKIIERPEELEELDLSELKHFLRLGMQAEAEDRAKAEADALAKGRKQRRKKPSATGQ
jgi:hypothetical protein